MKKKRANLRVREIAQERGMNITDLSHDARLAYSQAHKLWHNNVSQLDFATLERVADALHVQVGDLFAHDQSKEYTDENIYPRSEARLAS